MTVMMMMVVMNDADGDDGGDDDDDADGGDEWRALESNPLPDYITLTTRPPRNHTQGPRRITRMAPAESYTRPLRNHTHGHGITRKPSTESHARHAGGCYRFGSVLGPPRNHTQGQWNHTQGP